MKRKLFTVLLCLTLNSCATMDTETLNIGHRGARGHVAENTVASIEKAFALGADGVEIDVFKCKTGEIVVFHDEELQRLTGAQGKVEDWTYGQLQELQVDGKYPIPTLQEVIDVLPRDAFFNIELKGAGTSEAVLEHIVDNVENDKLNPERIIVSSFDWEELSRFRESLSLKKKNTLDIAIGVLTEEDPLEALAFAKEVEAQAIHPYFELLNEANVRKMHDAGFAIYTWTVNDPADIQKMEELGVEGIITDYPNRMKPNR